MTLYFIVILRLLHSKIIQGTKLSLYIISLIFAIFGHMEILSQLIKIVDQHPDSIVMMRQQTEQRLPAHQHDKAQLLLVYGGIAYLQTDAKDFWKSGKAVL